LVAPFDWRVENFARNHQIEQKAARETVRKNQDIREGFLKTYLAEPITNQYLFDALINRERVSLQI